MPHFLPIDILTLALGRGLMQVMLGGLLAYVGDRGEQGRGARLCAIGFLLNGLSLFLFAIRADGMADVIIIAGNHLAQGAASAYFLLGFWGLGRQRAHPWLALLMVAIPIVSVFAFELAWPNARLRILTSAIGQVVFLLALQASLRCPPRQEVAHIYRFLRVLVVVYTCVLVWAYASVAQLLPVTATVSRDYQRVLFSVASLLFMLSLAVGCLALRFALLAARNEDLAMLDWLTGLPNRRGFFRATAQASDWRGSDGSASVVAFDVDHFKEINDQHGHAGGDHVLRTLADILRELASPADRLARMGGEEFCIVMPGTHRAQAYARAEAVLARCRNSIVPVGDGRLIRFTVSAGVCEIAPQQSLDTALLQADAALYEAKREGRDRARAAAPVARHPVD
ncbi:MAG: GGDEF domain-containing protein [Xanthomonadales bacterium]|nr:GGDEF domain-containing protein [Xanthomonadales bacterium]